MGTRNLIMVVKDNQTKVAQYSQWDGYPEGQGKTVLDFLLNKDVETFKKKLELVRFATEEDIKDYNDFCEIIGVKGEWVNMDQSAKINAKYPLLSRDVGAEILNLLYENNEPIWIHNSETFAGDGLFCEWGYVVDLDKNTFEVYEGYGKEPLDEGERFVNMKREGDYSPIKLIKSYSLLELPSEEEFINYFKTEEE